MLKWRDLHLVIMRTGLAKTTTSGLFLLFPLIINPVGDFTDAFVTHSRLQNAETEQITVRVLLLYTYPLRHSLIVDNANAFWYKRIILLEDN